MERLDKILVSTGRWSRKEAALLIKGGRVTVNGGRCTVKEEKFSREGLVLMVDGAEIGGEAFHYIMLHKPSGVISATRDNHQETVLSLLPPHLGKAGLFPVGRLDKDTEGLLLLTNDGDLAHRLLSPSHHVDKVYYAEVESPLTQEDVDAFAEGIILGDGLHCLPAKLEMLTPPTCGLVTIQEGKFHQVKRMMACRGKPISYLKRLSMGNLNLDDGLEKGEWRTLSAEELEKIKKI